VKEEVTIDVTDEAVLGGVAVGSVPLGEPGSKMELPGVVIDKLEAGEVEVEVVSRIELPGVLLGKLVGDETEAEFTLAGVIAVESVAIKSGVTTAVFVGLLLVGSAEVSVFGVGDGTEACEFASA
jgi:hypothetical protein